MKEYETILEHIGPDLPELAGGAAPLYAQLVTDLKSTPPQEDRVLFRLGKRGELTIWTASGVSDLMGLKKNVELYMYIGKATGLTLLGGREEFVGVYISLLSPAGESLRGIFQQYVLHKDGQIEHFNVFPNNNHDLQPRILQPPELQEHVKILQYARQILFG